MKVFFEKKKNRVNKTRQDLWIKNVGDKIGPLKIKHFYFSDFKKVFKIFDIYIYTKISIVKTFFLINFSDKFSDSKT